MPDARSVSRCTNDPDVTFFQLRYQSRQVGHSGYPDILKRTSGSLGHRLSQTDRAPFGGKDRLNSSAFSSPQHCSEVARIFETIQTIRDILADPKASPSVRLKAALAILQTATTPPAPLF